MFRVFHMWAKNYIQKTFSIARSSLVKPLWLANNVWLQLHVYWASADFQEESSKNKVNQAANPTASLTVYREGSSSVGMHKRKFEAELGQSPKQMELFAKCYKKKEDNGDVPKADAGLSTLVPDRGPRYPSLIRGFGGNDRATAVDGCSRGQEQGPCI
ncbi:UNVERIFIED_CONTAM: hypothetical protein Slati_1946400 [Sesamum latifolium]|uniref:Uncharacterized protein n=1 Tax=Sesamum latifolium TaxID=2727402 RepID=A0AAW2X7M3_9LAMI